MKKAFSSSFDAKLNALRKMLNWITNQLRKSSLSDVEIQKIEIALEEALVNIIFYAYQGKKGMIQLSYCLENDYMEFIIKDKGIPFNPLQQKKKVDSEAPLDEREEGGLGILFMHNLMDKLSYSRIYETNILILRKNL